MEIEFCDNNMINLKFKLADPNKAAEIIYVFRGFYMGQLPSKHMDATPVFVDLPDDVKADIVRSSNLTQSLIERIKQYIPPLSEEYSNFKVQLEHEWKKRGPKIISEIERLTDSKINRKNLTCYITNVAVPCYPKGYIVLGLPEEYLEPEKCRKLLNYILFPIGEELLHTHYWQVLRGYKELKGRVNGGKQWEISEVIPHFVVYGNRRIPFSKESYSDASKAYFFLKELREELEPIWGTRKSFKDFIVRAYDSHGLLD